MCRALKTLLTKIQSLHTFKWISYHVNDECRLERIIPYLVSMIQDPEFEFNSILISTALRILTSTLLMIKSVSTFDRNYLPEYILPILQKFVDSEDTADILIRSTLVT